ncbi:MAG: diacylglycerol kinase [Micrococcaceae bacterium]|jgi:diacylglycerol kinase (ATP)|nr:diacylglycerol kinase [Micrococcaceae bacterium]
MTHTPTPETLTVQGQQDAPGASPTLTKRAAVVFNPAKNVDQDLQGMLRSISAEEGWEEPLWLETTIEDPGVGQARQALEAGVDVVIAAGGDGTVRCVASVLADSDTAMGLIPLGTGNLLARNLGIRINDPEHSVRTALTGVQRRIDVVRVRVDDAAEQQLFLVMAGLGFDAAIMADTNDDLKDRVGWLAYVEAGIRNLPGKPGRASISIDGGPRYTRRLRSFMVGNCGRLQGGLEIFPGAQIDDGVLDLLTLAPHGKLGWLSVATGLLARGRTKSPAVEYFQGRKFEVSFEDPHEVQLDGDHVGQGSKMSLTVDPSALTVNVAPDA